MQQFCPVFRLICCCCFFLSLSFGASLRAVLTCNLNISRGFCRYGACRSCLIRNHFCWLWPIRVIPIILMLDLCNFSRADESFLTLNKHFWEWSNRNHEGITDHTEILYSMICIFVNMYSIYFFKSVLFFFVKSLKVELILWYKLSLLLFFSSFFPPWRAR